MKPQNLPPVSFITDASWNSFLPNKIYNVHDKILHSVYLKDLL